MKKLLVVLLALAMVFAFAACGGSDQENSGSGDPAFEWSRTGNFQDADENYLMITKSEEEEYAGQWAITFVTADGIHGWMIPQEGETLHGDLTAEGTGEDPFIVTISEEGEDGVLLVTEAGDEYHFTPMEVPETVATLHINIEGQGEIAYAPEGEEVQFEEGYPFQTAVVNIFEGDTNKYTLAAKPAEGFKFVKWTKDGEDYSTDEQTEVEVEGEVEYIAVFEAE